MKEDLKWIDPKIRKPEGSVFWALTEGKSEVEGNDWVIRKLINDEYGDYRSLDYAASYFLPESHNGQSWMDTIHAWLPLHCIPVGR